MNPLLSLIPEFENYLEQFSNIMAQNLAYFISTEFKNKDLAYFHFERDFDDCNVVFISYDKFGKVITDCISLPVRDEAKSLYDRDNLIKIYPSNIVDQEVKIHDDYILSDKESEEYWDFQEDYIEQKDQVFDKWFCSCWHDAKQITSINVIAYLFIHESYDNGLNLNTMKYEEVPDLLEESNSIEPKRSWWKFW